MNYDWTNRKYVAGWKSDFPSDLASLCKSLAQKGGFEGEFVPEAAIVNYYTPSQIMGPHRDDAELTMSKPIVSISLGCDAMFCIETKPFQPDSEVATVLLKSGDVVVMGGDSREALHGVAVTLPETFLPPSDEGPLPPEGKRIVNALMHQRININVRQVEDPLRQECTFSGRQHSGAMSCSVSGDEQSREGMALAEIQH
jgi:alkylated DNA repair protein alkB family protein 1